MFSRIVALAVLVLLLAGVAAADTLYLKNGRKFDGRVVSETATKVVFEIRGIGSQTFSKEDVDRIEKGASIFDEYDERIAKTDAEDPAAQFALGKWCMENGLRKEGRKAFKTVIKLTPDHKEARTALGYIRGDGRWMTTKDFRKYQAKRKAELEKVLGTLKLGRKHKNADDVVCFRPPRGWKKGDSPDGLGTCFTGPELHGVTLVVGYEVACPADLDLFRKGVRKELESDELDLEIVKESALSDLGGQATKASVVRYGDPEARAERTDIFFERDEDMVHVWFVCPAEDATALSGLFSEIRSSFTCSDVESMLKAGEIRFELPDTDWQHGWGVLAELMEFSAPDIGGKTRIIGHDANPTFIMVGSESGRGSASEIAREFMKRVFTMDADARLVPDHSKEWTRKIAGVSVTVVPFAGTWVGSMPVDGYVCAFAKGRRVYYVLAMNLLGSMSRKYLKKDLNTFLDSLKIG
ncbi:MAG: hypothetical protein ABFS86_11090 [Planctomycetota bacterium]